MEAAAAGRDRVGGGAGQDVIERLLLDRVQLGGDGLAVDKRDEGAGTVLADAADAAPTRPDQAAVGAQVAAHAAVGEGGGEDRGRDPALGRA